MLSSGGLAELDFIEELRLRRWARENYVPEEKRRDTWHPVIHQEMELKDRESSESLGEPIYAVTAK